MTKAQELANMIERDTYPLSPFRPAAALLRAQDALLRQALEALEAVLPQNMGPRIYPAIKAIKEHLK